MSRRYVSLFTASLFAAPLFALSAPAAAAAAPVQVPAGSVAAKKDFCRITASAATVRAKPSKNAAALGTAHKGNTCTSHGWAEGGGAWVKVTIKRSGVTGYVHSSLVAWGKEGLVRTGP